MPSPLGVNALGTSSFDSESQDEGLVHGIVQGVRALHKADEEFDTEGTRLRKRVLRIFIVSHEERLALAHPRKAPLVERRVVAHVFRVCREGHSQGAATVILGVGRLIAVFVDKCRSWGLAVG